MEHKLHIVTDRLKWNQHVAALSGSILQSWEWGELKQAFGWEARRMLWMAPDGEPAACAQLLIRRPELPLPGINLSVVYCPRGPILDWEDQALRESVFADLIQTARKHRAIFLKIDPDVVTGVQADPDSELMDMAAGKRVLEALKKAGFNRSSSQIQFANTMELDLSQEEDAILAAMKQKTRYNIRLADRKGVRIRTGSLADLDLLYRMYAETSVRDGFVIRKPEYYQLAWGSFIEAGLAQPLIAEVEGEAVAAIIVFQLGGKAIYMYGMSTEAHRSKMPNHLLQWEAIRSARQSGASVYDFWGAPDELSSEDSMYGVYRFKLGFGARFVQTVGAWDYITRPALFWLYEHVMPAILNLMRSRGRAQTRQHLDASVSGEYSSPEY